MDSKLVYEKHLNGFYSEIDKAFADEQASSAATVASLNSQVSSLNSQVTGLNGTVSSMRNQIASLQAEVARLQAIIDNHEEPEPDPDPEPEVIVTQFGACPAGGGTSLAAAQTVITKWGTGAAIRQFHTNLGTAVPRPATASRVHVSFKPTLGSTFSDASLTTTFQNLKAGDVVEVWHEADSKVRNNNGTVAQYVQIKNAFYAAVKRVRPDLLVANTYTGWLFDPTSGLNYEEWGAAKADILGVDLDGVHTTTNYPNFMDEWTKIADFLSKFSVYKYWAVPEFGCPRKSNDPNGTTRATWNTQHANFLKDKKALYVCYFEYPTVPDYELTTTAEVNAWKAYI